MRGAMDWRGAMMLESLSDFLVMYYVQLLACLLAGATAGALGVFVMGMRMPFLTVCTTHAALAGGVLGLLLGWSVTVSSFGGALLAAAALGFVLRKRDLDTNSALGALFSLLLGLSFLGIGLGEGPRSQNLGLLWGSVVLVQWSQLVVQVVVGVIFLIFILLFSKELKVLLFSRNLAATLIPEAPLFTFLLIISAGIISVNLEIIGGLLMFGLIANPTLAANRLAKSYGGLLAWSAGLGAVIGVGGFLVAYWLDVPAGASIVLMACVVAFLARLLPHSRTDREDYHHYAGQT